MGSSRPLCVKTVEMLLKDYPVLNGWNVYVWGYVTYDARKAEQTYKRMGVKEVITHQYEENQDWVEKHEGQFHWILSDYCSYACHDIPRLEVWAKLLNDNGIMVCDIDKGAVREVIGEFAKLQMVEEGTMLPDLDTDALRQRCLDWRTNPLPGIESPLVKVRRDNYNPNDKATKWQLNWRAMILMKTETCDHWPEVRKSLPFELKTFQKLSPEELATLEENFLGK